VQNPTLKEFIICPDTTIDIGIPLNADFTEFGPPPADFPLTVLHSNVTIKCGDDGSSANNCALNGGYIQLITTPNNPFVAGTVSTDNLMVQGITFTGTLQGVPSPTGEGELSTSNIGLGAPGKNMIFDDCIFEGVTSDQLFYLHRDILSTAEDFPPLSADVTIKNSVFRNITYRFDTINTREQTIMVDNVAFEDLKYEPCSCTNISAVVRVTEGGQVDLKDCNFMDVEFLSSIVIAFGNETEVTYSNLTSTGLVVYDKENRDEEDYCELGLIVDIVTNGMFDSCENIFIGNETSTNGPSAAPSVDDSSAAPTGDPSAAPSTDASAAPTGGQSAFPTNDPTEGTSAAPTDDPSAAPGSLSLTSVLFSGIVAAGCMMMMMD
jgi:hypothetical protein